MEFKVSTTMERSLTKVGKRAQFWQKGDSTLQPKMNTKSWTQCSVQSAWEIKAYSMLSWRKNSAVNVIKIHALGLFELKESISLYSIKCKNMTPKYWSINMKEMDIYGLKSLPLRNLHYFFPLRIQNLHTEEGKPLGDKNKEE